MWVSYTAPEKHGDPREAQGQERGQELGGLGTPEPTHSTVRGRSAWARPNAKGGRLRE